ncbi:MAG: hypothetical protein KHZ58_17160 [Hungatella hathewayi]|nr:hypothetical protein [Hungatella hathewayi]
MAERTFKSGSIWMNIGEVASQTGILGHSCYQCAHFYSCRMAPQTPVLSE